MDFRAQSALEYLMTYGWTLIVIAVVVGTLVLITGQTTNQFACSSDSTEIILKDYVVGGYSDNGGSFDSWTGEIVLQNATGGSITITDTTAESNFFVYELEGEACGNFPADHVVESAGEINIVSTSLFLIYYPGLELYPCGQTLKPEQTSGSISFDYTTASGLSKTATITCNGTPPRA